MIAACIHITYVICLIIYINKTFLEKQATWVDNLDDEGVVTSRVRISPEADIEWLLILGTCLLYPLVYDTRQACKQGADYLADVWNYMDMIHLSLGYLNLIFQKFVGTWELPSKITMIIVTVVCLLKTFFFMRIVKSFSYIVTMIISVVADLKVFMLFFFILIIMFSMIFNVIAPNPADEYRHVGLFWGNVLTTLRLSLGDFDFGVLEE